MKSNAARVAADIRHYGTATVARAERVVTVNGARLEAAAKKRASVPRTVRRPGAPGGKEGPRLLTGDFNRSIVRHQTRTSSSIVAEVGSNAPQALRLEHGFHGEDAIGRHFEQRAYPTFGPALDEVTPRFRADMAEATKP